MLSTIPIKKRIKILVQASVIENLFSFNKISHILSQYNVFESHMVDDFLLKISKNMNFNLNSKDLTWQFIGVIKIPIIIDIYKKKYKTEILICGLDFSSLLKRLMDRRLKLKKHNKSKRRNLDKYSIFELFKVNLINNLFFINISSFNYIKFKKKFFALKFISLNLKDRVFMKSRKINFKRKDRKNAASLIKK